MLSDIEKIARKAKYFAECLDQIVSGDLANSEDNLKTIAVDLRSLAEAATSLETKMVRMYFELTGSKR